MHRFTLFMPVLLMALLAGCANPLRQQKAFASPSQQAVFSLANDPRVPPWTPVPIRFKTETRYSASELGGQPCILAEADASWSLLAAPVPAEFAQASELSWRWHVPALIPGATGRGIGRDDAPVRVVIGFKGDMERIPAADRAAMNMARVLGGWQLPYASIQYLWEAEEPSETILDHHTVSRIKKIVVRSGPDGLGQWLEFKRNVREDYRRAFAGEEPGEIESIGIMTDAETLGVRTSACYADLRLR